jgi:tRNA dimethylallyltransferase
VSGKLLAIVGATATGKTGLAIDLARRVGGEIISMDSRQVYRGMDIGTAKVTREEREAVPHYGLDLVDPDQRFSAGQFARYAREMIAEIEGRGKLPLLVGGTGFFLRALTNPIFAEPTLDTARREALAGYLSEMDEETLLRWLDILDPESATRLRAGGGRQRLIRALELPLLTGRTLSWWHSNAHPAEAPLTPLIFVLDMPREELDRAIERRTGMMMEAGLVEEVAGLLRAGYDEGSPGMSATGYREIIPVVRGEQSPEQAAEDVRRSTRSYSRRQVTWFRNQLPDTAVRLDATAPREALVDQILARVG